jgi:uncharacterized RDD family membrane protein YckC
MQVTCPRCKRSLSTDQSEGPPAFCMYCGQKLRDDTPEPRGMLTASHVPFTDNPQEEPEPPPSEVGGYRLLRFLGAGGMGAVFEAEKAESGARVAVKLLSSRLASSPASVERFRQEGRLASQLAHPRCVFVLAADTDAGRPYIVMELMPGRTLKDLIDTGGPLPVNDAVTYILDAIDGLAEAHRLGMIHRDVKPSNCFLTEDGRVKVGDFGLSKSLAAGADRHLTQSGAFLGTVLFASPEQIRGEPLDYASDIYSVCATLYYLLCGNAPYDHESATAALAKAISEPPPPICVKRPDVSRALERVVMRGLERDRDRRWQSLDELRDALIELLPAKQTPARPRVIIGAYFIDWLLLIFTLVVPEEILRNVFGWEYVTYQGVHIDPVGCALFVAYFATLEGLFGRTLGKALLGLRVSRIGECGPPGLERGWIRAATFSFLWFWTFYSPPLLSKSIGGFAGALGFTSGIVALLVQLRRTEFGYRGLHDLLSGCHVTQKPRPVRRLRLHSRFPSPLDSVLEGNTPEPLPGSIGGYAVKGRLWAEPLGEQVWLAEDRALNRRVLVWLMADDGNPMTPIPNDVPRLTRLRRLGRGTIRWSGRDLEWVAFAAPVGAPLLDAVQRPLTWPDARTLIEQLTDELIAAETDGSLPKRLSLEQIWVEPNGRLQLLDFPLAGMNDQRVAAKDSFELLRLTVSLVLEGTPRGRSEKRAAGIRAPIPPHAAPMFQKLFASQGYSALAELQTDLRETHAHSPEVTPAIRTAHVGIQAALLSFGLLAMFVAAGVVGVMLTVMARGRVQEANETLKDLGLPARHEELRKMPGAAAAIANPRTLARIQEFRQREEADAERRREAMLAPQLAMLDSFDRAMEAGGKRNETAILQAEHELLVWAAANEKMPAGRGDSPWPYKAAPIWVVVGAIPLAWILGAGLARGGLSMLLTGIAVVRADGRRASRRQCLLRAAVVWLPIALLLAGSVWVQVYRYQ